MVFVYMFIILFRMCILFAYTICHEKYEEYQKIKKEYENFPREIETGRSKSIFTMNQREYERIHPPRNVVLSTITEESISEY